LAEQKTLTFRQLAQAVLATSTVPLTAREVWDIGHRCGLTQQLATKGKTPWTTLRRELTESKKLGDANPFGIEEGDGPSTPWRFYLKAKIAPTEAKKAADAATQKAETESHGLGSLKEADLHPLVAYVMRSKLGAYCSTIKHHVSSKTKGATNVWLHPDMMGVSTPFEDLHRDTIDLARAMGSKQGTLFSIEIKRALTPGNLSECYFQAVSNSQWANEGYLAAAQIEDDPNFRSELRSLSRSFGIGIIRLDIEDPDAAEILFAARRREEADWGRLNKMSKVNETVRTFVKRAAMVLSQRFDDQTMAAWFDEVLAYDEMSALLASKLPKGLD
jgi:uncharacterized protein